MIVVKQTWLRRYERLRQKQAAKRKTHYLFRLPGQTDTRAERERLIASGKASPSDKFIEFYWCDPPAADGVSEPPAGRTD
jgi:hypothetical protein